MKKQLLLTIGIALLVGGIGFYAGMQYGQVAKSVARGNGVYPRSGSFTGNRLPSGTSQGGFFSGEIISKDTNTLTIKMGNGSTALVLLSGSTSVNKFSVGALDDISIGNQVMVTGEKNPDGSLNAKSIQIQPTVPKS